MKYMLLIHQGTTPTPPSPEWDDLSEEEKGAAYGPALARPGGPRCELPGRAGLAWAKVELHPQDVVPGTRLPADPPVGANGQEAHRSVQRVAGVVGLGYPGAQRPQPGLPEILEQLPVEGAAHTRPMVG